MQQNGTEICFNRTSSKISLTFCRESEEDRSSSKFPYDASEDLDLPAGQGHILKEGSPLYNYILT